MVKDFKEDTWEIFNEKAKNKDIYIWGCGIRGKEIIKGVKKFGSCWKIAGFIDSNALIKEVEGYPVLMPNQIKGIVEDALILISIDRPGIITELLDALGIEEYYSYYWMNMERKDFCLQKNIDERKITQVKELLFDEYSKKILEKIVEKRKKGFLDYTDIQEKGDEYFAHDFFCYENNEILIDGGGYDGDTIEEFVLFTQNTYEHIYCFEPDQQVGKKISDNLSKYNGKVNFYPYGLYDRKVSLPFVSDNVVYSSHIAQNEEGTLFVECVCLDDIIKDSRVTFIKMDIEGAEIFALKGAENVIKRNKPKLAICLYHRPNDLWEIPLLIHSFVPEYKFFIRHYGSRYYSTILFATI